MNRPFDAYSYQRLYKDGFKGMWRPCSGPSKADRVVGTMVDYPSHEMLAITFALHNGQRVIVRPLSPLRRQMREDDRKARDRFIPTMNLDGTTNYETATRLAQAFVTGEPQRMKPTRGTGTMSAETAMALNLRAREVLKTACDHLGPRGYGE